MKALLVDHDDSFTFNLRHWLKPVTAEVRVVRHTDVHAELRPDLVVLSPGPKSPADYPHVLRFIEKIPASTPVFGVCLGLQMLVHLEGGQIIPYTPPRHGKSSPLRVTHPSLNFLQGAPVARYHSLYCAGLDEKKMETLAVSADDGLPMWLRHRHKKWMGVQFHPESFLTADADLHRRALKAWLNS